MSSGEANGRKCRSCFSAIGELRYAIPDLEDIDHLRYPDRIGPAGSGLPVESPDNAADGRTQRFRHLQSWAAADVERVSLWLLGIGSRDDRRGHCWRMARAS